MNLLKFWSILAIGYMALFGSLVIGLKICDDRIMEKRQEIKMQEENKIIASIPSPKFKSGDIVYCKIDSNKTRRGIVMRCLYSENTNIKHFENVGDIHIQIFLPYFYKVKFFAIPDGSDISIASSQSISSAHASLLGGQSNSMGFPNEIKIFSVENMREDEIEKYESNQGDIERL